MNSSPKILTVCLAQLPRGFDEQADRLLRKLHKIDGAREKAASLSIKRRHMFIASRLILTQLIESLLAPSNTKSWLLSERKNLPPLCILRSQKSIAGLNISLSHSGPNLAIAITTHQSGEDTRLGIDIEQPRTSKPLDMARAKIFCSEQELKALAALPNDQKQQQEILKIWTQKEAFFKGHHQSIFNEKLTSTNFSPSNSTHSHIKSCLVNEQLQLSVYYPQPCIVEVSKAKLSATGQTLFTLMSDVDWHNYQ